MIKRCFSDCRWQRVPNSNEVMGYQADIGYIDASAIALFSDFIPNDISGLYPLWGSLVDENRPEATIPKTRYLSSHNL